MAKKDRVIYADAMIKGIDDTMSHFVMAFNFPEERMFYIKKMCASFEVLKVHLRIMVDENIFKGRKNNNGEGITEKQVFDLIARIDEGICRWRRSHIKGRAISDTMDVVG